MHGKYAVRLLLAGSLAIATAGVSGAEPPAIASFAQLPVISGARLSPDGTSVAFFRPVDGRRYLVIQTLRSSDGLVSVPAVDELDFDWLHWANDERLVFAMSYADHRQFVETRETRLLSVKRNGEDFVRLVRPATRSVIGSRVDRQELAPPQIQDNVIDWLPDEPNHILVALDEDHDGKHEVRRIDIRNGDYDEYKAGSRGIQHWLTDLDHQVRIGFGYDLADFTVVIRPGAGDWQRAEKQAWWTGGWIPVGFTADPSIAYAQGPDENGLEVLRLLDIRSGELGDTVFAHEEVDLGGVIRDRSSGVTVGVSYVDDFERRHYFDTELATMQASIDKVLPDTVNEMTSYSGDRRRVLVRSSSDIEPGVYYFWDRDAGTLDFVAETMPGLNPDNLAAVRPVRYAARDGVGIDAYLTVPRGADPIGLPTVVLPHGGPRARDDRSFWFLSQFLASRGYAVLQPNFRGSSGYGRAFADAGQREWGGKMQDDVTDGTQWLVDEGIADPARLCIVGWSYGGYAAAMGAVKTPDLYRCAASINGVLNLPRLIADDKNYIGGRAWTQHMGLSDERAATVSPYHRADEIRIPVLIVQALDDSRVPRDQGDGMYKRLRRLKKPVEYVEVELGGHSMYNEAARLAILGALESFLAEHLAGERS